MRTTYLANLDRKLRLRAFTRFGPFRSPSFIPRPSRDDPVWNLIPSNRPGELVSEYEAAHTPIREMPVRAFLRELMKPHGLTQRDLPEIGAQSVVSAVLSGKRELNVRQIAGLSARFGLPADAFMAQG